MNTIRFVTYSKRKLKYELIDILGAFCFLSIFILAIGQKIKNEFIKINSTIFITLFIIGFVWIIARLFVGKMKWYKPFEVTGELEFNDNYLVLRKEKIELNEIRRIKINATQCKGLPSGARSGISDGTGNHIELFLKTKLKFKEKFVIERLEQRDNLKLLMDNWKQTGVVIIGEWKPFLYAFQK